MTEDTTKTTGKSKEKQQTIVTANLVHIDTFLNTAKDLYNLSTLQIAGFKAYMAGQLYQPSDKDFLPYLNKYLGKGE